MTFSKREEFLTAAKANNLRCLKAIYKEQLRPEQEIIDKALREAAQAGSLSVVKYLSKHARASRTAVSNALLNFCKLKDVPKTTKWELIRYIDSLTGTNKPSQTSIDFAYQMTRNSSDKIDLTKEEVPKPNNMAASKGCGLQASAKPSAKNSPRLFKGEPPKISCFFPLHLKALRRRRDELIDDLNSCWSFFTNRELKKRKITGLDELIRYSYEEGMTITKAIKRADTNYPALRAGWFSKTNSLLEDLLDADDQNTSLCC